LELENSPGETVKLAGEGFQNDGCFDWNVVKGRSDLQATELRKADMWRLCITLSLFGTRVHL